MCSNGVAQAVVERYHTGAVIIGISAGAIQLGAMGHAVSGECFPTFNLVPYVIGTREEDHWPVTSTILKGIQKKSQVKEALVIPARGGVMYFASGYYEAMHVPFKKLSLTSTGRVRHHSLIPQDNIFKHPEVLIQSDEIMQPIYNKVADILTNAKNVVCIVGHGCSLESGNTSCFSSTDPPGVPNFQGSDPEYQRDDKQATGWAKYDPQCMPHVICVSHCRLSQHGRISSTQH